MARQGGRDHYDSHDCHYHPDQAIEPTQRLAIHANIRLNEA